MAGDDKTIPAGPWVLVLGMHRSGTSALAGALGHFGLALPVADDLVAGRYDNPVHYESAALTDVDDTVLADLGGSWSAPPPLPGGWERAPHLTARLPEAVGAARRAFPGGGPVVWKDPRLCLLLPWWRTVLPEPVATVFLWRAPLAVARSLHTRQRFTVSLGLALWDRYARAAGAALDGHPAYVVRYEALLADPAPTLTGLGEWLAGRRVAPRPSPSAVAAATEAVSAPLARHEGEGELPRAVSAAVDALADRDGAQGRFDAPDIPPGPGWMADVIEQQRAYEALYARYLRYARWRRRIPVIGRGARRAPPS